MCKAFKSSTAQDQQVVTKSSVPKPMAEMYNTCDRPPALSVLSGYRCVQVCFRDIIKKHNWILKCGLFISVQGWPCRCHEVLHGSLVFLWPVEGKNASGYRGQEKRKEKTQGICSFFGGVKNLHKWWIMSYKIGLHSFYTLYVFWLSFIDKRTQEQKRCVDGTLPREVKKVRKAHNRRQEWNMMAFDKELRPDHRHHHHHSLHRGVSPDGVLSMEGR